MKEPAPILTATADDGDPSHPYGLAASQPAARPSTGVSFRPAAEPEGVSLQTRQRGRFQAALTADAVAGTPTNVVEISQAGRGLTGCVMNMQMGPQWCVDGRWVLIGPQARAAGRSCRAAPRRSRRGRGAAAKQRRRDRIQGRRRRSRSSGNVLRRSSPAGRGVRYGHGVRVHRPARRIALRAVRFTPGG